MVAYMDEVVGNVTRLVKDRGMWGDTVVVMSSDNGGPIYAGGGGNNYPLKGGKISDWEGGVRVNAWVSGGFLPPQAVGTKVEGLMHLADWYATFCHLAGIDTPTDPVAEAAGLPPIDSLNMWPVITGANKTSPRHSLHVSPYTLIQGEYKVELKRVELNHPTYHSSCCQQLSLFHLKFCSNCILFWHSLFYILFWHSFFPHRSSWVRLWG